MREWIKKRQDDLFKRELPLMSATAVLVPNHREADAKRKQAAELREEIRALLKIVQEKREEASRLDFQAETLENIKLTDVAPQSYTTRCFTDGCRGWLGAEFSCNVCLKNFCVACHVEKEASHKCDNGQVESVRFIAATSRGCPTCATWISKTEGCDQMYCTVCDTAFSWRSGAVENGIIHNPHYLKQMNMGGHVPRMVVGSELVAWREVADLIPRTEEMVRGFYALVYDLLKKQDGLFKPVNNDYERAQFMIGKMTETKFRSLLQVKEKRWLLRRQVAKSTDNFIRVGCSLFNELLDGALTLDALREKIQELRVQANAELLQVSRRWERLCVPFYDENFSVKRQKWRAEACL
jgi:hypothetical protein